MKIAFISQPWNKVAPPVDVGSVAILMYEAARRLAGSHHVCIFSKLDRSQAPRERVDEIDYYRIPSAEERMWLRRLRWLDRFRKHKRPDFSSDLFYKEYISEIANSLESMSCDVVQIFNMSQFAPVIKASNPNTKIALRMSCEWLTQIDRRLIEPRLDAIDVIFGCSDFITRGIQKAFPAHAKKCRTILNGRDVDRFSGRVAQPATSETSGDAGHRLLFVGRLSPEKGIHTLIEAFGRVVETFPDTTLDIIGPPGPTPREYVIGLTDDPNVLALAGYYDTNYTSDIRVLASKVGAGKIRLRGSLPHQELPAEYEASDILVFPSIWDEPSGNPPIEAMASGVPVISTTTGGTAEYVTHGKTGLLVPPGDPAMLADSIVRLLGNDSERREMGLRARKDAVARFSYDRFVADLERLYIDLCGPNRIT